MMDIEVGIRLNDLRRAAVDVQFVATPREGGYSYQVSAQIRERCLEVILSHMDAGVDAEIAEAAKDKREALLQGRPCIVNSGIIVANGACQKAYAMAYPEMVAIAETHNTRTASEYERYRVACEQGAAVRPQKVECGA